MSQPSGRKDQEVAERRRADRTDFAGDVTIRFDDLQIVGPGQNISETGIYFVTEAQARVRVLVGGQERTAELVRVENVGQGRLGIAVRFVEAPASD